MSPEQARLRACGLLPCPTQGFLRRAAWLLVAFACAFGALRGYAQEFDTPLPPLTRPLYREGEATLRAFKPVSDATRHSIVKFNVDGETMALGVVMDASGLVLTKASELKPGKLTCWLATDKEVSAEVLAVDEDEDVALVRVHTRGLKPLPWASEEVVIGQWAVTPGVAETPHAVGIISALPRRIRPQRAFIGVRFDARSATPRIDEVREGFGAAKAGLKPGDLIVAVNGTEVTNRETVVELLRDYREGQSVKLAVQRDGNEFTADVKLMPPETDPTGNWWYAEEPLVRLTGEVSHRSQGFERAIEHDSVLQPWLCGGPLVDLKGEGIGLNIARANRVTTYALPPALVKRLFEQLKAQAASKR